MTANKDVKYLLVQHDFKHVHASCAAHVWSLRLLTSYFTQKHLHNVCVNFNTVCLIYFITHPLKNIIDTRSCEIIKLCCTLTRVHNSAYNSVTHKPASGEHGRRQAADLPSTSAQPCVASDTDAIANALGTEKHGQALDNKFFAVKTFGHANQPKPI